MTSAVSIKHLTKTFNDDGTTQALDDVSLEIGAGEAVSIIGPNGAGKSTLLKVIAGILSPTYGNVRRARVCSSIIELGAEFHPDLTVWENIEVGLALGNTPRRRKDRTAVLEFAGITDAADRAVRHLSNGMVARLACSLAIRGNPDVLLMDEVLAVGDAAFQDRILDAVDCLVADGCSLLLVTHSMHLALRATRRAVWIDQGRVVADGPVTEVVERYEEATRGWARASDSVLRIEHLVVAPDQIWPGDAATLLVNLACAEPTGPIKVRVEARPIVGEDTSWMRTPSAPPESHLYTMVATTHPASLDGLDRGGHRLVIDIAHIPITPTQLELSVLVSDLQNRVLDEAAVELAIGTSPRRPQFDLRVAAN